MSKMQHRLKIKILYSILVDDLLHYKGKVVGLIEKQLP